MNNPKPDFYQKMRRSIREWAAGKYGAASKWSGFILLAPDLLHLLCRLAVDKAVPARDRVRLAGAAAYFILPLDFIPEVLVGPIGYLDDIALAAYILNSLLNQPFAGEIVKKHWAGEAEILDLIKRILKSADEMISSGLWLRLKNRAK